jgi:hypothetical protein
VFGLFKDAHVSLAIRYERADVSHGEYAVELVMISDTAEQSRAKQRNAMMIVKVMGGDRSIQ